MLCSRMSRPVTSVFKNFWQRMESKTALALLSPEGYENLLRMWIRASPVQLRQSTLMRGTEPAHTWVKASKALSFDQCLSRPDRHTGG